METWNNLCRGCLSSNTEVSITESEENLGDKFQEITTIQVTTDDNLPQKLCNTCYSILTSAYTFKHQCIKMDEELKRQLQRANYEGTEQDPDGNDKLDFGSDPVQQLQSVIKTEGNDSDDDFYYVVVIDNPNDKADGEEKSQEDIKSIVKKELATGISTETENQITEAAIDEAEIIIPDNTGSFENTIESFLVSNSRVPQNVPATILENEDESQDSENNFDNIMHVDDTQDSTSQDIDMIDSKPRIDNTLKSYIQGKNNNKLFKIITAEGDTNTILLEDSEVAYLTEGTEDGDSLNPQEVIFCERNSDDQLQIVKYDDGSAELVIEYANDDEIATVIQQDDGTFLCECGEKFEDLSDYEKHQARHTSTGSHVCNICGKGFETEDILTGHALLHHVTTPLIKCPFCDVIVKRNVLTQHIKYVHNTSKPTCSVCLKTFSTPNNLKRHMMIHTGVKEFECDICFKRFHQKITLQTHKLTHSNQFSCNLCNQIFETKELLASHKESEHTDVTESIRLQSIDENLELGTEHTESLKEDLIKSVKQQITSNLGQLLGYSCSLCKKMFSVESALEQHIEAAHIIGELYCNQCCIVLPNKKSMQAHILKHKQPNRSKTSKRFECSVCGKVCSSQAMLVMHERVHTNERPYPCQLCTLRFKTKTHLRTHQLTHTREKKFGCSVCMKFFALKGNLVVHLRTHTGERPYVCSICEESFIDSKYLKKHKLKKHAIDGNVPYDQY